MGIVHKLVNGSLRTLDDADDNIVIVRLMRECTVNTAFNKTSVLFLHSEGAGTGFITIQRAEAKQAVKLL